jgi:general secretion pathway protein G
MRRGTCSGFTLIELMVVVIIIAALAGMVLPHVLPASEEAKKKIARGDIANISMALKMYRLHNGKYPAGSQGLDVLTTADPKYGGEAYLESDPVDPWGNQYIYKYPGSSGKGFDIISGGPDGAEGGGDDVSSADKPE